jgi:DNA helicase-2/ATP-dependent DNA helicase PcrA
VEPSAFFELVDEVLVEAGRSPLHPGSPQRKIVEVLPDDRVLQIVAGPGSGKTEMLVWRVLFALVVARVPSHRIVVTTFTRKAATELTARVVERSDALIAAGRRRAIPITDPRVQDLRIGTIHGLCDALLAEFDDEYIAAGTQLIDDIEVRVRIARGRRRLFGQPPPPPLLERVLGREAFVALFRPPWVQGDRWPSSVMDTADWLLGVLGQHMETWVPRCGATTAPNGVELVHPTPGLTADLVEMQRLWEGALDHRSLLDFATLQQRFIERQGSIRPHIDHVFVDEFQDTNPAQYLLHTGWLAREATRLTVVGDDDQALYRFRGSDIACFQGLAADCASRGVAYRQEVLDINYRGTPEITGFAQAFRRTTALARVSMDKRLRPPPDASSGRPVRLLRGAWQQLACCIADEVRDLGPRQGSGSRSDAPTVAILLFSTSEKGASPALSLRQEIEARGVRVHNPRNKVAGRAGSPVHDLLALLSYLMDPVTSVPLQAGGRPVEVHATHRSLDRVSLAVSAPPATVRVSPKHAAIQKRFVKRHGRVGFPGPVSAPLLQYVDDIRGRLLTANDERRTPRLTLAGFVARLLSFSFFRDVGYTIDLFREALFTALLEANIAPTRMSPASLDAPLGPTRRPDGKIEWPDEFWTLLSFLGMLVADVDLDDPEVEAFAEDAVAMLTFHQAKGLEFDHVYVGMTGREANPHTVLRTKLFSGEAVPYSVEQGTVRTGDPDVLELAAADRDREIYVAMTRARSSLTFIDAPGHGHPLMRLDDGTARLFGEASATRVSAYPTVTCAVADKAQPL